jgi:hypothetical protein
VSLVRTVAWSLAAPAPTDPGVGNTVAQDPDAVREQACRIVSANPNVCAPPTTPRPPSDPSGGFDLSFLGALFWILLIALLVLAVALVMRNLGTRSRSSRDDDDRDADDLDEVETGAVLVDRSREPVDWRKEAEVHRRAGRFRDSMRCRYRALVGDLARRGLIDEIPGRTTGEERAQLRVVEPAAAAPFDAAADLFDDAWYGHVTVDADSDDRFQQLEQRVLGAVGGRR